MNASFFRRWFGRSATRVQESIEDRAERGDPDAQFRLGLKFATQTGPAPDYPQAARWYLKAADQNHTIAQFNLGVMYAAGQGMAIDKAQSILWIGRAANLGDAAAQHRLGLTHHHASLERFPKNASESRTEAYKWLRLADAQGYRNSDMACELVTLQMSQEEVADGIRRVAAFVAASPNGTPKVLAAA